MIAEFRYLWNTTLLTCAILAVVAVSIAVAIGLHLGTPAAAFLCLFLLAAAVLGATVLFLRRLSRAVPNAVPASPTRSLAMPIVIDFAALACTAYGLTSGLNALHRSERVSHDVLLLNGFLFVWLLVIAIRDVRSRIAPAALKKSPFDSRKLAAVAAAYNEPTPPGTASCARALAQPGLRAPGTHSGNARIDVCL